MRHAYDRRGYGGSSASGKGNGESQILPRHRRGNYERIIERVVAAREAQTLPADEVLPAIALKHGWTR
jgi:hypothetical protein